MVIYDADRGRVVDHGHHWVFAAEKVDSKSWCYDCAAKCYSIHYFYLAALHPEGLLLVDVGFAGDGAEEGTKSYGGYEHQAGWTGCVGFADLDDVGEEIGEAGVVRPNVLFNVGAATDAVLDVDGGAGAKRDSVDVDGLKELAGFADQGFSLAVLFDTRTLPYEHYGGYIGAGH